MRNTISARLVTRNPPVAVLLDFEQFRVLDCRYKPDIDTTLSYGAPIKFHYTDYADEEKFRHLYHLFSGEDVGRGALDDYAADWRGLFIYVGAACSTILRVIRKVR